MSYWVYILQSESTGSNYCGQTNDVERRIRQHNDAGYTGSKTTKRFAGPWKQLWIQELCSRAEAMQLERKIKRRGIERFLIELML